MISNPLIAIKPAAILISIPFTLMLLAFAPLLANGEPNPDAAVAPLGLFGTTTPAEKKIIFNRFEKRLSEHYRLLSSSQYKKARDKVFETVQSDQCTEKYCIRKIQETLQVERLFFLEITVHEPLTQLNITLIRMDDTLIEESTCRDCRLEDLYVRIGILVERIAARDLRKTPQLKSENKNGLFLGDTTDPPTARTGLNASIMSNLSREEIIRHSTALSLIAISVWQSKQEATVFKRLADENKTISRNAAQSNSESEYADLVNTYQQNQAQMEKHKQNILIYDIVTVLALTWEVWEIHNSMVNSVTLFSGGSSRIQNRGEPDVRTSIDPVTGKTGITVSWAW